MKCIARRTAAALTAAFLLMTGVCAAQPHHSAKCAIVLDGQSGRTLYAYNADEPSRIASTTKIMTGLLVCECCDLQKEIAVPPEAVGIEGTSLYLQAGERITLQALLYGMMLHSGNDAAQALAIACDGSAERFAARMNRRARELGLRNTHYVNPSGLDAEGHCSTARDLALLTRHAMQNADFRAAVGTKTAVFGNRTFVNHNRLLWRYDGADGVKTGYTKAAGRILVSHAARDGRELIAVTINDPNDWADHAALLDYGFSQFTPYTALTAGERLGTTAVFGGTEESVGLLCASDFIWPLAQNEKAELRVYAPHYTFAPVLRTQAGYCEILQDGTPVGRVPLYYEQPVAQLPRRSLLGSLINR